MTDAIGRLLCWVGRHDWENTDSTELEADYEEEGVAIHYSEILPVEWECSRCGETEEIGFQNIELKSSSGTVLDSWK